jgi:type IV secretory pathway TrbD component
MVDALCGYWDNVGKGILTAATVLLYSALWLIGAFLVVFWLIGRAGVRFGIVNR